MDSKRMALALTVIFLTIAWPLRAYHEGANYARVRFLDGGLSLESGERPGELPLNAPLIPGDVVSTGPVDRAELQFTDGNYLRLDYNSRIVFVELGYPGAGEATEIELRKGSVYFDILNLEREPIVLLTPIITVVFHEIGVYRIDRLATGSERITVVEGVAEVLSDTGRVLLRRNERTYVSPGSSPEEPNEQFVLNDGFDRWNGERLADYDFAYDDYLPSSLRIYAGELEHSGSWVHYDDLHDWIWVPRDIEPHWHPFLQGRWVLTPAGFTWIPFEPWGWVTVHYGRWILTPHYGWVWIPGTVFSPAWVVWHIGLHYVAWSPASFSGSFGFHHHDVTPYHRTGPSFGHTPELKGWTVVPVESFESGNIRHKALPMTDDVDRESLRHAMVGSLTVHPRDLAPRTRSGSVGSSGEALNRSVHQRARQSNASETHRKRAARIQERMSQTRQRVQKKLHRNPVRKQMKTRAAQRNRRAKEGAASRQTSRRKQ